MFFNDLATYAVVHVDGSRALLAKSTFEPACSFVFPTGPATTAVKSAALASSVACGKTAKFNDAKNIDVKGGLWQPAPSTLHLKSLKHQ
jgi:hypothetical protein